MSSDSSLSRREMMAITASAAAGAPVAPPQIHSVPWPITEGPDTPKICLEMGNGGLAAGRLDEAGRRRIKQLGVNYVLMGGPRIPWQDEEIENVKKSSRAAGRAGLPVIEYNFYAHRIVEGYYEETGRGGAGLTAFDYERVKNLPPLPQEGAHSLEEMWRNITYFLKAVIPVAEDSGVRMALHPNDPPAPISRGSGQIMGTVEGWKRLIEIVPSKSNGITFDCGVTR